MAIGLGLLLLTRGSGSVSNSATNRMPACATQDAVFLPAESYGNFVLAVDSPVKPLGMGNDPSQNPDTSNRAWEGVLRRSRTRAEIQSRERRSREVFGL
jgi:hypothetical protein